MSFVDFAAEWGVLVQHPIPDGTIRRAATVHKPKKTNARYRLFPDGGGWVNAYDGAGFQIYQPEGLDRGDPLERERRLVQMRARMSAEEAAQHRAWEAAAQAALVVVRRCTYAVHPYLMRKGLELTKTLVDTEPVRFDPDSPDAESGCIVVPMRHWRTGDLQSVQWINAAGRKKFLRGGKVVGAVFSMGPQFAPAWVCEGFATAASVQLALQALYRQDRVVACFTAHNLAVVARKLGADTVVVADHDRPDWRGHCAGQAAALSTGLPWVMSPVEGEDLNDMSQRAGVRAVAELLRSARS